MLYIPVIFHKFIVVVFFFYSVLKVIFSLYTGWWFGTFFIFPYIGKGLGSNAPRTDPSDLSGFHFTRGSIGFAIGCWLLAVNRTFLGWGCAHKTPSLVVAHLDIWCGIGIWVRLAPQYNCPDRALPSGSPLICLALVGTYINLFDLLCLRHFSPSAAIDLAFWVLLDPLITVSTVCAFL